MPEPLDEQAAEETQNVLLGLFTITLMLGITYQVGSWVWALIA